MVKKLRLILLSLICVFALSGCYDGKLILAGSDSVGEDYLKEVAKPGEFDSEDISVVTRVSKVKGTITFYNYELSKYYTLSYDSITKFSDKYGNAISVDQLKEGIIADVKFLKSEKLLTNLTESSEAFFLSDVTGFSLDSNDRVFNYKIESYKLSPETVLLGETALSNLDKNDVVSIVGMDTTIYAITVTKGHGYLSLKGEEGFIDGTMEIGFFDVCTVKEGMEILVPEGEYDLTFTKKKSTGTKHVTIEKDKKTVLDISDIELYEEQFGKVLFNVIPENAKVYVDDVMIDNDKVYEYGYGMHKLYAFLDGYETTTRYFKVAEPQATLPVELEKTQNSKTEDKEEDKTEGYFIFISSPSGVEISFDGNYVGMSPLSIKKVSGNHTIALRKNGYVSRTYSVLIENTAKDVYYNFEGLEEEKVTTSTTTSESTSTSTSTSSSDSGSSASTQTSKENDTVSGN